MFNLTSHFSALNSFTFLSRHKQYSSNIYGICNIIFELVFENRIRKSVKIDVIQLEFTHGKIRLPQKLFSDGFQIAFELKERNYAMRLLKWIRHLKDLEGQWFNELWITHNADIGNVN